MLRRPDGSSSDQRSRLRCNEEVSRRSDFRDQTGREQRLSSFLLQQAVIQTDEFHWCNLLLLWNTEPNFCLIHRKRACFCFNFIHEEPIELSSFWLSYLQFFVAFMTIRASFFLLWRFLYCFYSLINSLETAAFGVFNLTNMFVSDGKLCKAEWNPHIVLYVCIRSLWCWDWNPRWRANWEFRENGVKTEVHHSLFLFLTATSEFVAL